MDTRLIVHLTPGLQPPHIQWIVNNMRLLAGVKNIELSLTPMAPPTTDSLLERKSMEKKPTSFPLPLPHLRDESVHLNPTFLIPPSLSSGQKTLTTSALTQRTVEEPKVKPISPSMHPIVTPAHPMYGHAITEGGEAQNSELKKEREERDFAKEKRRQDLWNQEMRKRKERRKEIEKLPPSEESSARLKELLLRIQREQGHSVNVNGKLYKEIAMTERERMIAKVMMKGNPAYRMGHTRIVSEQKMPTEENDGSSAPSDGEGTTAPLLSVETESIVPTETPQKESTPSPIPSSSVMKNETSQSMSDRLLDTCNAAINGATSLKTDSADGQEPKPEKESRAHFDATSVSCSICSASVFFKQTLFHANMHAMTSPLRFTSAKRGDDLSVLAVCFPLPDLALLQLLTMNKLDESPSTCMGCGEPCAVPEQVDHVCEHAISWFLRCLKCDRGPMNQTELLSHSKSVHDEPVPRLGVDYDDGMDLLDTQFTQRVSDVSLLCFPSQMRHIRDVTRKRVRRAEKKEEEVVNFVKSEIDELSS